MTGARRLLLRLGTDCDNRCAHCTIRDLVGQPAREPQAALAAVRTARADGCDELVIMRGEPTLRPDLVPLLETARDLGYRHLQIQTNGRRLAEATFLDRLVAAGVTLFEVSLYGPDAAVHDAVAGVAGAFAETTRGLAGCLARGLEVLVTVPVVRANVDRLGETVALLHRLGARGVQLNFTRPIPGGERVVSTVEEAAPAVRAAVLLGRRLGLEVTVEALPPCVLGGVEDALLSFDPAPVRIVDLHRTVTDLAELRQSYRPFAAACQECDRVANCAVTWAGYLEGPRRTRALQAFPRPDAAEVDAWLVRPPAVLLEEAAPRQWDLLALLPDAAPSPLEAAAAGGFPGPPGSLVPLRLRLEAHGAAVRVADLSALYLGAADAYARAREHLARLRAVLLGVELRHLVQLQGALEVARSWRALHPGGRTVLFGAAATGLARELLERYVFVDFVVAGAPSRPLRHLLAALRGRGALAKVPGLWHRRRGRVVRPDCDEPPAAGLEEPEGPEETADAVLRRLGDRDRLRLEGDPAAAFGAAGLRRFLATIGARGRDVDLDLEVGHEPAPGAAVVERLAASFRSVRLTLRAAAAASVGGGSPRRGDGDQALRRCLGAVAAHDTVSARVLFPFGAADDDAAALGRLLERMRLVLAPVAAPARIDAQLVERWHLTPGTPAFVDPAAHGYRAVWTDLETFRRALAAPLFSGAVHCSPGGLSRSAYLRLLLRAHADVNRLLEETGRRRQPVAHRVHAYVDVVGAFLERFERLGPGGADAPLAEARRLGLELQETFLERALGGATPSPATAASASTGSAPARVALAAERRVAITGPRRGAITASLGLDDGAVGQVAGGLGELRVDVDGGTIALSPAGNVRSPTARTDAFDIEGAPELAAAVAPALRRVECEHPERLPALFAPMQERSPAARLEAALAGEKVEELVRVTMTCNQRCLFCSVDPAHERRHDPDTVRAFIRGRAGGPFIVFSGGEPTLDERLPEYLRLARDAGYPEIVLQTNALRCAYPAYARKLAESGLRSAFVSLHSHEPKVSDALTRTPGSFALTVRGIDALLEAGVMVWLNFVATARNVDGAEAFVGFAARRFPGLTGICFSLMAPVGAGGRVPSLWPRLGVAGPRLAAGLAAAASAGLPAKVPEVCGLPLCLLPGMERFSESLRSLPADSPAQPDRTYAVGCARCRWRAVCSGYWKVYLDRFGDAELIPREGPPPRGAGLRL